MNVLVGMELCMERDAMSQSEGGVQAQVRVSASKLGWRVWRNNVGVLRDERGVPVRYGLCNESTAQNKSMKSSDLIGIRPILITQDMVGRTIGQFVSIEMKKPGWKYAGTEREEAQLRWIELVRRMGGHAHFSTGAIDTNVNLQHNASTIQE